MSHNTVSNIAGNVLIRYSSANNERTGHLDFNFGRKNWGFLTNVSHSMFNNLRQGANGLKELDRTFYAEKVNGQDLMIKNDNVNMQIQSAYNQVNVLQKFFVKLSDHVDMGYNFQFTTSTDIPWYDRLGEYRGEELKYAEWYYGPQQWMMNTLQLDLHDYKNCFNNAKIPLAYQLVKENRNDRKFESDDLRSKTEKVNVLSLNMDFDKKINQKISLYYRAEGVYNYVKSTGGSKDISSGKLQTVATRYLDNAIKLG